MFGDVAVRRLGSFKRAWETALLKVHGFEPEWGKTGLSAKSRAALRGIDLHFHDLRHEGASRLVEAGWPLHHVQQMLGHATLQQTSTYVNAAANWLADSMRRFGAGKLLENFGSEGLTGHPPLSNVAAAGTPQRAIN